MPEMHRIHPGFIYIVWGPFTEKRERIQKFKETEDPSYIYQKKLDKTCFQLDMSYGGFKDFPKRAASDIVVWYYC